MVIETALMISSFAMMAFGMVGGKSKKGKKGDDNPVVGTRYFGDSMLAYAYYSENTASMWANRIFYGAEESYLFDRIDYANFEGERQSLIPKLVNSGVTTSFSVPFDAAFTNWAEVPELHRMCKIPYPNSHGQAPQYPCHTPGVALLATHQTFMGFNSATFPSFSTVWSQIPGSVYYLMREGGAYANQDLWVRWRRTVDLGWVVNVNPVCIVIDLLLDQSPMEDINFESFAYTGKKLIEQHPYMWFAMAMGVRKHKDAVKDVLAKARLALKQEDDGRVGCKMLGEIPENGPVAFTQLDALEDLSSFTITIPDVAESEVLNEARGTYQAARFTIDNEFERNILSAAEYAEFKAWADANPELVTTQDALGMLMLFPPFKEKYEARASATAGMHDIAQFEGHLLQADMHAVNTGNIVLTGIRRQESFNLDFLSWPDDAKAYLEETLIRNEKPYAKGSASGGMWLSGYTVGDLVRIVVQDIGTDVYMDKVFEVVEVTLSEFGKEEVRLDLKENHTWYEALNRQPDGTVDIVDPAIPDTTWDPDIITPQPIGEQLAPARMFMHISSPLLRGIPFAHMQVSQSTRTMFECMFYLVPTCAPESTKIADDMLASAFDEFAMNFVLSEAATIPAQQPGLIPGLELHGTALIPPMISAQTVLDLVNDRIASYSGTYPLFFDTTHSPNNYAMVSTARIGQPWGESLLLRYTTAQAAILDDAVIIKLEGVHTVDAPLELVLEEGSVLSILPRMSKSVDYAFTPVAYGVGDAVTAQTVNIRFRVRTVPKSETGRELAWDLCTCDEYEVPDTWLHTPKFPIYGRNTSVQNHAPISDVVFFSHYTDVFEIMFNAPDYIHMQTDSEMYGLMKTYRTHALDLDSTPAASTPLVNTPAESIKSGITKLHTTVRFLVNGILVDIMHGKTNAVKKTFSLADLGVLDSALVGGFVLETEVEAQYTLNSELSEDAVTMYKRGLTGPRFVYVAP